MPPDRGDTADLTARLPTLLRGYAAIGAYVGLAPRTVQRYTQRMGFPAIRWGRHVVSSPALIDGWLLVKAKNRRHARQPVL